MFFHVVLTDECNLQCRYCYGQAFEDAEDQKPDERFVDVPSEITYDLEDLVKFLKKSPDATITFYGGEPTLRPELIRKVMDMLPERRFMMQTNGMLLRGVGVNYLKRFHTILISVDGKPAITDGNRGKGVFEAVEKNIQWLRSEGFSGELIARMTVMEGNDIYDSVTWLLDCGLFDSVHWQLNANFWDDLGKRNFSGWVKDSYNPGVKKLANWWLSEMEKGKVRKIYPFLGISDLLLHNKTAPGILCGAGHSNFAVATDGTIVPCPVMAGLKEFRLGDIWETEPSELKSTYAFRLCDRCKDHDLCGGRCMYGNYMMPWGPSGHELVCDTVRNMLVSLKTIIPSVKEL
ncbi:MAG: TIGR04084 family radical SAM/SPASM domain-containing protein, partial [Candidatus Aenigmatarchaeota archaeon]